MPKWEERMTEIQLEDLYKYEIKEGIINVPNSPHYENFKEFLEMAKGQTEVVSEEEYVARLVSEILKEIKVEEESIPKETYETILIRSFNEPVYFKPEREQIIEIIKSELGIE